MKTHQTIFLLVFQFKNEAKLKEKAKRDFRAITIDSTAETGACRNRGYKAMLLVSVTEDQDLAAYFGQHILRFNITLGSSLPLC